MREIIDYVSDRIKGGQGRPSNGYTALERYAPYAQVSIGELVVTAITAAQSSFLKARRKDGKPFKLTTTSSAIGLAVLARMGIVNTNYTEIFAVGDVFIEALYNLGYIDIAREYEGFRAPYIVILENKWEELGDIPEEYQKTILIGTSFKRFPKIKGLRNPYTRRPYIKGMTDPEEFEQLLDAPFIKALDKLQGTEWTINTVVLKALRDNISLFLDTTDKSMRARSKRIEMKFILQKAMAIGNRSFFQGVECDYRGRVYYTEPFLNFQGSDISRSLFQFKRGKKLTESGFRWLCIHAASCYNQSYTLEGLKELTWLETKYEDHLVEEGLDTISVDKMTLRDRELWTLNHLEWIELVAQKRIIDKKAEKPLMFLAACLDISGYLKDPQNYESHLPIPIDGSNNGKMLAVVKPCEFRGSLSA